jgi:DNA replication and repair protein RecF
VRRATAQERRGGERSRRRALPLRHHADAHLTARPASTPALRLRLSDFRNFAALDWQAPAERLLLVGGNGAGKTTLLEAIYLASTGRSFRAPRVELCARRGSDAFRVELAIGERPRRQLVLGWSRAAGRNRELDGKSAPLAEHLAALPLLVWTHAEHELLLGPPALRRRFFDRGLVHLRPGLLESLGRYERALTDKRALLATGRAQPRELDAWDALLARHGAEIVAARAMLIDELDGHLSALVATSELSWPPAALRYRPSPASARDGEAALLAAFEEARPSELARRQPLVGPQRDEIEILWQGEAARRGASAGERKGLGLLLLAALASRLAAAGREPALLVDDADSELDARRHAQLLRAFAGFARVLWTSNRPEVWPAETGAATVLVERLAEGR